MPLSPAQLAPPGDRVFDCEQMNPWRRLNVFGRVLTVVTALVILAEIVTQSNALFMGLGVLVVLWVLIGLGFGSERGPRGGRRRLAVLNEPRASSR